MKKFIVTAKGEKNKEAARSKKGRTSRVKGASFERELAKLLEKHLGVEFVRTPQSGGFAKNKQISDGFRGDIVPTDNGVIFVLHIEAKNAKTWSFPAWIRQAEKDCPKGKIPVVVAHMFNTSKKYVLIDFEEFLNLVPSENLMIRKGTKR